MSANREEPTIMAMLQIYCRKHHDSQAELCPTCQELHEYVQTKLAKCPCGLDKPTCAECQTHCYKPQMRERIREVMRYAGPRMLLRHPVLTMAHLLTKQKRPAIKPSSRREADVDGSFLSAAAVIAAAKQRRDSEANHR